MRRGDGPEGLRTRGLRFLTAHRRALTRLAGWSVLESGQTFLLGYALARALDDGFLAGRAATGLGWLVPAALGVLLGAYGTGRVYGAVAALVEPLRDRLVVRVVERGVREADGGSLSGLTQQVEIARDTFAGLVMVSRSFVFTSAGALAGLCSLAPPLLLAVAPPLAAGVALFAATLRPLAGRQEAFLAADEALAEDLGTVCPGLRDVTAAGAEDRIAADTGVLVDAELQAARALARWGVARVACLALGGHLPLVLLLAGAPWFLAHGVTPGALVGALAYVTQALLPALTGLIHGLGTSGSRLTVVLRRLAPRGTTASRPGDGAGLRDPHPPGPATPRKPPALSVTALSFAYGPASAPVVDDLTLTLPAGGHLAVVGPSGVGKSTLTGLVAGLLEPVRGEIRICGRPVPGGEAAARRVLIPQEAYVFSGSLRENLTHLRPDPVPEKELLAAAEAVGSAPLVHALGGPEAAVDPAALSAGERQLIALTRAYLSSAPLALLDEATCHLDPEAEARAERAFAARPGGTLVVVAHRVSSARRAGRVLVMDGPRTMCGTHEEMVRRSALYRDLVGSWTTEETDDPDAPENAERSGNTESSGEAGEPGGSQGSRTSGKPGKPGKTAKPGEPGEAGEPREAGEPGEPGEAGPGSQPALPLGDADGVHTVAGAGLAGDRRHVVAHGPVGQVQAPRDLRDGGALGGEG
ncbi:ABC transporter ATP-binding protein [Streptomyces humidus]|uniref:ABC transporter ATP-binding protein n=1 Tax=Streptomyces humidus TaxID=52259 RepID=A0A918FZY9_9ACTN|nr:ABC transporter ATP-binding protein [Streptomyces humidus]